MTVYDYVAFGAMLVVFIAMIWLVIALGDLPANIARERNHSQVAAVRALSWFGLLFTGGVLWIFAIVWAFFDSSALHMPPSSDVEDELKNIQTRLNKLESTGDNS
jgi:multisubunit Na+/H+ antiporter MnhB subunit